MLVKVDHRLETTVFEFDESGEVNGLTVTVNYAVRDNATGEDETRVRKTADAWGQLTAAQKTAAKTVGSRLNVIAKTL